MSTEEHIWYPFTHLTKQYNNVYIERAEGAYLYTRDGKKIFDGISSWWVNLLGHGRPEILEAIQNQFSKIDHVIFADFTHGPAQVLSEKLIKISERKFQKVFFSDNGSTSVEVALKLAIQYNDLIYNGSRKKIVAFKEGYHGDTVGAMSVSERGIFNKPFWDHMFPVDYIDAPTEENKEKSLAQFKELIKTGEVGCLIFEPMVQGVAGMKIQNSDALNELIEMANENDIITIADEVMTGFYRTGKLFAHHYVDHAPDMMCLSKGITGGVLPLGATLINSKLVKTFTEGGVEATFYHGHSFTANPTICAAANASLDILLNEKTLNQINNITSLHQNFVLTCRKNKKFMDVLSDIRHLGTILAFEFKTQSEETGYLDALRNPIYEFFMSKGILMRPLGNVMYIIPPYCTTSDDLKYVYDQVKIFFNQLWELNEIK